MPMKRIQHVSLFKILPFLFLLLFFSTGCKNKKKEKIVAQKKVGCVKIFIDKSASMAGVISAAISMEMMTAQRPILTTF